MAGVVESSPIRRVDAAGAPSGLSRSASALMEVLNGELVIRGERERPELAKGSRWAFTERSFGRFERRLQLPHGIDPDTVTASMDNGVLSLIVAKPEALGPKTIQIGSGTQHKELETATA